MGDLWAYLTSPESRDTLSWLGGDRTSTGAGSPNIGNVGGVATLTSTVDQSEATTQGGNTAMADDTSAAVAGDVTGSTITVGD